MLGQKRVPSFQGGGGKKKVVNAFEDYLHLSTFFDINLKGRVVGAAFLEKDSKIQTVFGFSCKGIHDNLRDYQIAKYVKGIQAGLKELPSNGWMTLHFSSWSDDSDRQDELDKLLRNAPSKELGLLLMSEKARAQELASNGTRKNKELFIYVTYQMESGRGGRSSDWIEKSLVQGMDYWEAFKGKGDEQVIRRYEDIINSSFEQGYIRWEQLINIKMGLEITPLDGDKLWKNIWKRFNSEAAPKIPQCLSFDGSRLGERINSSYTPVSVLIQGENGKSSIPTADRRWVHVNGKYAGILTFTEKPGGFSGMKGQLAYIWDVFCRPYTRDTEVFCQISRSNPELLKTSMQRLFKQSNVAAQGAEANDSVDVAARIKAKKVVEAQETLYEGEAPVKVATVFVVHRKKITELFDACRVLAECFQLPAKLVQETELNWMYWLQTLPISFDKLLGRPYQRQLTYLSNEAPGLMPLTKTGQVDKTGFELIADDGGSPIKVDFINQLRNIAILGTTRSGKSVAISGMLTQFLAEGYPIVCLDYPKPDGTSTFTDYARFLEPNAAYFDIGKESNNLLEMPDLRHLPEEKQAELFEEYKAFLESALVTMVTTSTEDEKTVRPLIGNGLKAFLGNENIIRRYSEAIEGGYGSDAWGKTPTLEDFIQFCSDEDLGLEGDNSSERIKEAAALIRLQLNYWLNSRLGRAIGRPSSFPTDAQFLVFALRNVSSESEAAILSLSAYSAALRRALASPKSIFFIDEAPILFEYETIAQLIGRLSANGSKAGIRVFLSAQDPDTVMKSPAGAKVMQNMSATLIGRIKGPAVNSFVNLLNYDRELILRNASESFFPKKSELYSNWLLDIDGKFFYCRYYPSAIQLAVVANNTDEQEARERVLSKFDDKYEGIAHFATLYTNAIRNGIKMDEIGVESGEGFKKGRTRNASQVA